MQVAFCTINCAPFKDCRTEINDTFVDYAVLINIAVPMYNLIEYSDSYSDISGSLLGFKTDDVVNNADVTNDDNAPSFKYKPNLITDTKANGTKNGIKVAVPLKYLSNFWRLLEIPLINCKVEVSLKWIQNCVLTAAAIGANATGADSATLKITDAKLYVPVFTLSTEDNVKLVKQLNEGFKRSVYWNKYKVIDNKVVETAAANEEKHIKELIDSSYQGAKRLFVLMIIQQMIIKSLMILLKNIFFQELKLKTATSKLMEEIFMTSQLMIWLSNSMKSEKY